MSRLRDIIVGITALVLPPGAAAQQHVPVDYNALDVEMSFNPAYYGELLSRFEVADPTLQPLEMSHVYYGFVCSPGYGESVDVTALDRAMEQERWNDALSLAMGFLDENPVSLDVTVKAATAAYRSDARELEAVAAALSRRVEMLVTAILSSGHGTMPEMPFHVTSYDDALALVREILQATQILGRSSVGDVDAIKFTLNGSDREHILYFKTYKSRI